MPTTPDALTDDQRHWLHLADQMLQAHTMPDAHISWLAQTHNITLAVHWQGGRFILRLQPAARTNITWLRSEMRLLRAVCAEMLAPCPVVSDALPDGVMRYQAAYGVLLHYVDGATQTPDVLTPEAIGRIGHLLARLHSLPTDDLNLTRPRLDADGLFGAGGLYDPGPAALRALTSDQRTIIDATVARVRAALDAIGTEAAHVGLIHADLLLKNILFQDGAPRALDFEYCGWGHFIYDLAPLLWQLKTLGAARYQPLADALWAAYTSRRPLPARQHLETMIAARQVASMRWLLANQHLPAYRDRVPQLLQQRTDELRAFLDTGQLTRA